MSHKTKQCATHVLVVDDEPNVLELLAGALESYGYSVTPARTAECALDMARQSRFDLVLCDLYLPGMNGAQLTSALSRMHPQMPVVLITSYGDLQASRQALESGAIDFITKPLELATLPFVLESNLQRKKLEARRLSNERAEVLFKAIKALAAAVDNKSHYTDHHSARMAELCLDIGNEMCLSKDQLYALELAAHIHDVGKMATPDRVLNNPAPLSDDEWVDILKHPGLGADFLSGIEELSEVASAVRHHHEHMDGCGYPDGLKGEAIPLLARVLAVADAFEAMTSPRPYREARTPQTAMAELRVHAGTQFDPVVVEAAIATIQRALPETGEQRAA